jgi:hypothetical protein
MRIIGKLRTSTGGAAFFLLVGLTLGLASASSAAPTFTLKTKALPIPGVPRTGDILGAGAVIQVEGKISGTEYGGYPPPLTSIRYFAPAGATVRPQAFVSCAPATIEQRGPEACPKRSLAGPLGSGLGVVSFGSERVPETATVQPIFAPGGGLELFVDGNTPVSLEILAAGHVLAAAPPFSMEFMEEIPLIETVPGALDASILEGTVRVGAAYKQDKRTVSYVTLPHSCAKGGWLVKVELGFLGGASAQTTYDMPCPAGRSRR